MYDLVSRDDVLAVLKYCKDPIKVIKNLPSATAVRYGEWMQYHNGGFRGGREYPHKVCGVCNYTPPFSPYNSGQCLTRYCPHCGARMVR